MSFCWFSKKWSRLVERDREKKRRQHDISELEDWVWGPFCWVLECKPSETQRPAVQTLAMPLTEHMTRNK